MIVNYMVPEAKQREVLVGIMASKGVYAPCEIHFGEFENVPGDADSIAQFSLPEDFYKRIEGQVLDLCDDANQRRIRESELVWQLSQIFAEAIEKEGVAQ